MDLPSLADLRPALLRQRDTTDPKRQERLDKELLKIFKSDFRPEDLAAVQVLLAAGANPDARHTGRGEYDGKTIMQYLVMTCLPHNDAKKKNYENAAPFMMALLAAGADPNQKMFGGTLISVMVEWAKPDMVRALIKAGADANVVDSVGNTVLMKALGNRDINVVLVLIAAGADVNRPDRDGETPLSSVEYHEKKYGNPSWGDVVRQEVLRAAGATGGLATKMRDHLDGVSDDDE